MEVTLDKRLKACWNCKHAFGSDIDNWWYCYSPDRLKWLKRTNPMPISPNENCKFIEPLNSIIPRPQREKFKPTRHIKVG